jgi:excisionase family DNA binding protein
MARPPPPPSAPLPPEQSHPLTQRLTLTVEEAATLLGISRAFAYEAVNAGTIPSIRIGHRILVPKAALNRMLSTSADIESA